MMQTWKYKARDRHGKAVRGEIEGESRENVFQTVSDRGMIPISAKQSRKLVSFSYFRRRWGSAGKENLIVFTQKLRTLHRAGIPLLRAFSIIERGAHEIEMKQEVKGIKADLESGRSLSAALAKYPRVFPPFYINCISAGEASGALDDVLDQLAVLTEKELILTRQLKSALRYPATVIVAVCCAIFILMTFVIPRFADIYGKYGGELPWPTQMVTVISNFFASYWYVMLVMVVLLVYTIQKYKATEKGRLNWDTLLTRLPIAGDLVIKTAIARFAYTFRILFQSGIPMISCLKILRETITNRAISGDISQMEDSFEKGSEIGRNLENYRYMPSMALEMMEVGLESGSLEDVLGEIARHYESEIEFKSRHLMSILEPLLIVVMGALVLILGLAVFLPMWNLIQVFR